MLALKRCKRWSRSWSEWYHFVLVMEVEQAEAVLASSCWNQVRESKVGCSSRCVQVGCCEFLVSIFRWSMPPTKSM
jgi:hypothetical protein